MALAIIINPQPALLACTWFIEIVFRKVLCITDAMLNLGFKGLQSFDEPFYPHT